MTSPSLIFLFYLLNAVVSKIHFSVLWFYSVLFPSHFVIQLCHRDLFLQHHHFAHEIRYCLSHGYQHLFHRLDVPLPRTLPVPPNGPVLSDLCRQFEERWKVRRGGPEWFLTLVKVKQ